MKPLHTALFFTIVFIILIDIAIFFPNNGIKITQDFRLKYFSLHDIFQKDTVAYADITDIIEQQEQINDSVITSMAELSAPGTDTNVMGFDTVRADASALLHGLQRIEFPANNTKILHPAFRSFNRITNSGEPLRILHYGDSQIEGDRITSYLRNRLQQKFGGRGVGLIPASQPYEFGFSITQKSSDNWFRYTLYGRRDTLLPHNKYGALASFCRFTPAYGNFQPNEDDFAEATVSVGPSPYGYSNTKAFDRLKIFYGNAEHPFMLEIKQQDNIIHADMYPASNSLKSLEVNVPFPEKGAEIKFSGYQSPDIYALALDGKGGIAVDNIAMRGSSGLLFNKMHASHLKSMYKKLNVSMFILQYGGNVVPYIEKNPAQYGVWFARQLRFLQKLMPGVPILVIGVADMSEKVGSRYQSYPHLEEVRDAMKKAAFDNDCAYWDMFEAMGGRNSMPSWVFAQPALASTDFVHFTPRGAKLIAQMFYNALMYEYNLYSQQNSNQ